MTRAGLRRAVPARAHAAAGTVARPKSALTIARTTELAAAPVGVLALGRLTAVTAEAALAAEPALPRA